MKHGVKQVQGARSCLLSSPTLSFLFHTAIASVRSRIHPFISSVSSRVLNGRYQFPLSTSFHCAVWLALSPLLLPRLSRSRLPPPISLSNPTSHILPLAKAAHGTLPDFWLHVVAYGEGSEKGKSCRDLSYSTCVLDN
jgi:hypothetical protein